MTQFLGIGTTDYSGQTLEEIKQDIIKWKSFVEEQIKSFEDKLLKLENDDFWKKNVPFNLKVFFKDVPKVSKTILKDFKTILDDIKNDYVLPRDVKLLRNIGELSNKYKEAGSKSFHCEIIWEEYGNPSFKMVEELYYESGDNFGTMIDAVNAAERLEDYMIEEKNEIHNDNSTHIDNSVKIGDNNKIKDSQIGINNKKESKEKKEKPFTKIFWHIIIPIFVGIAIAAICLWLGLKGN